MEEILKFERRDEDDFYFILGCNENSTEEQINVEYKARVLGCHPDKHPEDASAHEHFSKLSKAKDVLLDSEKRKEYDTWRNSGIAIPFERWKSMSHVKCSMHWAERKEQPALHAKDLMRPAPMSNSQDVAKTNLSSTTVPPMNFVHREPHKPNGWESDSTNPMLQKFRNYQI